MIKLSDFYGSIRGLNVLDDKPVEDNTVAISYYKLPSSISSEIEKFAPRAIKKVTLSRREIFDETDTRNKIIKILVWGYSNNSRSIGTKVLSNHLDRIVSLFDRYRKQEISNAVIKEFFDVPGISISTVSKILYFMQAKIEGYPAFIVDSRVLDALPLFEELYNLPKGDNVNTYRKIVVAIGKLAKGNGVESDQIEYFLFNSGKAWSAYLAAQYAIIRQQEIYNADYQLLDNLLKDNNPLKQKIKPKAKKSGSYAKMVDRKVVGDYHYEVGDYHLFWGVQSNFDYCQVLVEDNIDLGIILNEDFLKLFPSKGKKQLNYRYYRFSTETDQEKIQFLEKAKVLLDKSAARS